MATWIRDLKAINYWLESRCHLVLSIVREIIHQLSRRLRKIDWTKWYSTLTVEEISRIGKTNVKVTGRLAPAYQAIKSADNAPLPCVLRTRHTSIHSMIKSLLYRSAGEWIFIALVTR